MSVDYGAKSESLSIDELSGYISESMSSIGNDRQALLTDLTKNFNITASILTNKIADFESYLGGILGKVANRRRSRGEIEDKLNKIKQIKNILEN